MNFERLPTSFFARPTVIVAKELIGKLLIHQIGGHALIGRIVETEAYCEEDPACHAWTNRHRTAKGLPPAGRSAPLFGPPGHAYIYLNYGMYWLFNVVTECEGRAGGVLVRAVEPVAGIERMRAHRANIRKEHELTNGPGKLSLAFGIGPQHHGQDLSQGDLYVACSETKQRSSILASPRIGISKGTDHLWRFSERDNPFVSIAPAGRDPSLRSG